jgi:actin-related protein
VEGFDERINREIRMRRPQETRVNVVKAFDPELDSWHGGVMFARRDDFLEQTSISKSQYEECGPYYLKQHFASNHLYGKALDIKPTIFTIPKRQKTF